MKNLKFTMILILMAGLGLSSCSKDDEITKFYASDSDAVRVNVSINDNLENPKTFDNGDLIGLTANNQQVVAYVNSDGTWKPLDTAKYIRWETASSPMTFHAFYPVGRNDASMTTFTLPSEQSELTSMQSADYMRANATVRKGEDNKINLSLKSQTALVKVIISDFSAQYTEDQRRVSAVKIYSAKGDLTTSPSVPKEITPYETIGENNQVGVECTMYSAIVLPTDAAEGETFITLLDAEGNKVIATNIPKTEAGYSYTCNLMVSKESISVLSIEKKKLETGITVGPYNPFYDTTFEQAVITKMKEVNPSLTMSSIDVTNSNQLAALKAITILDVGLAFDSNKTRIKNLKGLEYLTGLTELDCQWNSITKLDVSDKPGLKVLKCDGNRKLTKLDVSKNLELTTLVCGYASLTELDVSKNQALTVLDCRWNNLTELDVSKNIGLTTLMCGDNSFTNLDISKNRALTEFRCSRNNLTELDVTKNIGLTHLHCAGNDLMILNVVKNTRLTLLYCNSNNLTKLDVSKNTGLINLNCAENSLAQLDVSNNIGLTELFCHNNSLAELDVSKNTELTLLYCYINQLSTLNVSNTLDTTSYQLLCGNQTSDSATVQQISLNLTVNQKEHWDYSLSRDPYNKNITLIP